MANNFSELTDLQLNSRVSNLTSVMIENPTSYGLTLDQVEELQDANNAFDVAIATSVEATGLKVAANDNKAASRGELLTILSSITQRVYGDPSVTDADLSKAGFSQRPGTRQFTVPNAPSWVNVILTGTTTLTVRWDRAGNSSTTQFIVERKIDGVWTLVGSVTASKLVIPNVVVGEEARFRVYAQRGNRRSDYSNETVIWDSEGPGLSLAA